MDADAVESVHPSLRKITKQGVFPHENALLNTLFENCRIVRKMERLTRAKSGYVGNQLMVNPEF